MIFFLSCIGYIVFTELIKYINKNDDEKIEIKNIEKVLIFISIVVALLLLRVNNRGITFVIYSISTIYLIIVGYIDYKTKSIYSFINRYMLAILIIFNIINIENINFKSLAIGIFITFIFSVITRTFSILADGDIDVFYIASIILGTKELIFIMNISLVNIIIALWIGGLVELILVLFKKVNLKDKVAFAPFIAISTIILMVL